MPDVVEEDKIRYGRKLGSRPEIRMASARILSAPAWGRSEGGGKATSSSIATDPHVPAHYSFMPLVVFTARRGWAAKTDVLDASARHNPQLTAEWCLIRHVSCV